MPKGPTDSLFRSFFEKETINDSQHMVCQLEINTDDTSKICGVKIKDKLYNLKRHIESAHKKVFEQTTAEEHRLNDTSNVSIDEDLSYFSAKTVKSSMSMHEFDLLICERVVRSGRPLSDFNDPALKKFLKPYCDALGVTINNEYAKKIVLKMSTQLVDVIKQTLKITPLHLIMDGSTRHAIDYIAAGVQYFDGETGKPKIAYLGVVPSLESQTAENIKTCVGQLFEKYGLRHCQLISNTVDNGANYVKACKLLLEEAQANVEAEGQFIINSNIF